ncbi:MAG: AMP-binding protein, partial [Planctomycetota bacterium]
LPDMENSDTLDQYIYRSGASILVEPNSNQECENSGNSETYRITPGDAAEWKQVVGHRRNDDPAMLIFTSGSSAEPKMVVISHRNLLTNCESIWQYLPLDQNERAFAISPFGHALGNSVLQTHLLCGACLVLPKRNLFPSEIISELKRFHCTSLSSVPEFFDSLLTVAKQTDSIPDCVRYFAVAGGKMNSAKIKVWQRKLEPAQFFVMYGQSEATARLAYLPPNEINRAPHTVGQAIPGVELEIRSDGQIISNHDEVGTLFARGENVMLGYWNDSIQTHSKIQDGWLNTGDLARWDESGFIEICGRIDGLIKINGYRFHPQEIETILGPELFETRVVATTFKYYGLTRLGLFAETSSDELNNQKLRRICQAVLPRHMMPQRFQTVREFPLRPNGKIDRQALAQKLETSSNRNSVAH